MSRKQIVRICGVDYQRSDDCSDADVTALTTATTMSTDFTSTQCFVLLKHFQSQHGVMMLNNDD